MHSVFWLDVLGMWRAGKRINALQTESRMSQRRKYNFTANSYSGIDLETFGI
jgi:hypothetical protein